MSLQTIYVTRHGFRSNWSVEKDTGLYHTHIPSPTGIAADPALAGYGVLQARELARKLVSLEPRIERAYSSPFYRCLQTLEGALGGLGAAAARDPPLGSSGPTRTGQNDDSGPTENDTAAPPMPLHVDPGLSEWFGTAPFAHPSPAPITVLRALFPHQTLVYVPSVVPEERGETIAALHDRVAYALQRIIEDCDREGVRAVVICTHAATLLALGRALTGCMPREVGGGEGEDFRAFTCGLSEFVRRRSGGGGGGNGSGGSDGSGGHERQKKKKKAVEMWKGVGSPVPKVEWRGGIGVGGGWDCVLNSDCSFLSGGEERGWRFSGDESFLPTPGDGAADLDAGAGLGVVVEGKKKSPGGSETAALSSSSSSKGAARL